MNSQRLTNHVGSALPVLVLVGEKSQRPGIDSDILRCGQKVKHDEANSQKQNVRRFRVQGSLNRPRKTDEHEPDGELQRNDPGLPPADSGRVSTRNNETLLQHGIDNRSPQHLQRVRLAAYHKQRLLAVGNMLLLENDGNRACNADRNPLLVRQHTERPLEECTILTTRTGV